MGGGGSYVSGCTDIFDDGPPLVKAFESIFADRKPQFLQCDAGREFINSQFQSFLKQHNVKFFVTHNSQKASICERFNRTLKTKMWKYFTHHHTYRYIDVLDSLLHSYNHAYHSSIKRAPVGVTKDNESEVWFTLYGDLENVKRKPFIFQVGDTVRVSKHKMTFEKGYETNWTEELFIVTECIPRHPPVYRIKDLLDEPIKGTFYPQELQKVQPKKDFAVEKVLQKRTRKGHVEYKVKFKGYPSKFDQWISSSNLFDL